MRSATAVRPLSVPAGGVGPGYHERPRPDVLRVATELGVTGVACDFGCGAGILGQALLERGLASSVIGVEQEPAVAALAKARLTTVITGNVIDSVDLVPPRFDTAIFADILEHLADPLPFVRAIVDRLAPDGKVVVSLPNVRHARIALSLLLRNEWEYTAEGVCDATHLRFFTSRSAERLLREAGLVPVIRYGTVSGRGQRACRLAPTLTTLLSTQILFGCVKEPSSP